MKVCGRHQPLNWSLLPWKLQPLEEDDTIGYVRGSGCELANLNPQDCDKLKRYEELSWAEISATAEEKQAIFAEMEVIEKRLWQSISTRPPAQRTQRIAKLEYDAFNAFGTPIREETWCAFAPLLNGEKLTTQHVFWTSD